MRHWDIHDCMLALERCRLGGSLAFELLESVLMNSLGKALSSSDAYRVASCILISMDALPAVLATAPGLLSRAALPPGLVLNARQRLADAAEHAVHCLDWVIGCTAEQPAEGHPVLRLAARQLRKTVTRPAAVMAAFQHLAEMLQDTTLAGSIDVASEGGGRLR